MMRTSETNSHMQKTAVNWHNHKVNKLNKQTIVPPCTCMYGYGDFYLRVLTKNATLEELW